MKRVIFLCSVVTIVLLQGQAIAQKKLTEGKIIYDLKVDGDEAGMMAAMMPTELVMKFKGTKARTEFSTGMAETIALSDSKEPTKGTVLLDIMGNRYAMKLDEKTIEEQNKKLPDFELKETTETKEIAGHKCKKAILTDKKSKEEVVIFYTEEIPFMENSMNAQFKSLKGMPMEYSADMNGVNINLKVRSITKEKIADTEFVIPSDYKPVTQDELMKELGAGGE